MDNLGAVVAASLDRLGLGNKLREQLVLIKWQEAVGDKIAGVTRADRIQDGIVWVACKSSVWANELTLHKENIRTNLNRAVGRNIVKDLRFSSRGYRKSEETNEEKSKDIPVEQVSLSEQQVQPANEAAAKVTDPDLAEAIRNAVLTSLKREQAKQRDSET